MREPKVIAGFQESINQTARFHGHRTATFYQTAIPARESERKLQVTRQVLMGGEPMHGERSVGKQSFTESPANGIC